MSYGKRPFKERLALFFAGRNGVDTIGVVVWTLCFACAIAFVFSRLPVFFFLELPLIVYVIFRMLSRNVAARRREDAAFRGFFARPFRALRLQKQKRAERKTHIYEKCPHCKNTLRLPRVPGDHTVCCPCCHTRFDLHVKK